MPFKIIREDITKLNVDAIVNAANSRLKQGGGVCGAIFFAAGEEHLQKACDRIGHCATGSAVITPGFKLKAKYIIHTVGPIFGQNPHLEADELYSCYESSLKLAKKNNIASIAFPLISTGIYGYPKRQALSIATKAIVDFLANNEMDVFLVVYDSGSYKISEQLFENVKAYISDREVKRDFRRKFSSYNTYAPCDSAFTKSSSLEDILQESSQTFSQKLFSLIDRKGMSDVEVYKRANIDRKLFSKMRKADYVPKKTTVIALIIALRLDMDDAKDLLMLAGFAFSPASKTDLIIQYFIEREEYDIYKINETLFDFNLPLLGA